MGLFGRAPKTEEVVEAYLASCRARRLAAATVASYGYLLRRLPACYERLPDRVEQLERWLGDMRVGKESYCGYVQVLRQFYKFAIARGYTAVDPALSLPMPRRETKVRRVLTARQTRALWRACEDDRDRALVSLVLDTGVRIGEAASITARSLMPGSVQVHGKSGQRVVDADQELVSQLMAMGSGETIWQGLRGPLTVSGLKQRWRKLCERAGLSGPKLGPHTGRHTHATYALALGEQLASLQERLGHRKASTTMLYIHPAERIRMADRERVSPLRELIGEDVA